MLIKLNEICTFNLTAAEHSEHKFDSVTRETDITVFDVSGNLPNHPPVFLKRSLEHIKCIIGILFIMIRMWQFHYALYYYNIQCALKT